MLNLRISPLDRPRESWAALSQSPPSNAPEHCAAFDPFDRLVAAAKGDLQAQRQLARKAVEMAFASDEAGELLSDPATCLTDGLVFARLAAAQGELADQGLVIGILELLAEVVGKENAEEQRGEAIARLSLVADLGEAVAADALPSIASEASETVMVMAKDYAARIKDKVFQK